MNIKKLLPITGIIILIYIFINLDFNEIIQIFSKINPIYAFLSFFTIIPLLLLVNVEWQFLLKKQKINVSFWYSIKNFFIGYFYGFITPGGFGAYTRSLYLSEESGAPLPKCISNILIYNAIEFVSILFFGAIGALVLSSIYPYLFITIVFCLILTFVFYLFFFKKERSKKIFQRLIKTQIFATVRDRLENSIDSFYEDLPTFKDVLIPFSLSIAGWFLKFILLFYISQLFLINIELYYFVFIIAVGDVIASIPISIYGVGTRDGALITMFLAFGVSQEPVFSFSIFWFVILWLVPSIIGAFVTVFETKKLDTPFKLDEKNCKRFEDYMKKHPELYEYLADIVKKNISRKNKNPYIVDLGVGPGLLSLELFKKLPDATIIGVDPSKEMLKLASRNNKDNNFETRIGGITKIPVTNNLSDIVVSRFSLTYWDTPRVNFAEINRILKTKGKVVMEFLNRDFPKWRLFWIKIRMYSKFAGHDTIKYHIDAYKTAYSIRSVKTLLTDSGFKILNTEGNEKHWKFVIIAQKK